LFRTANREQHAVGIIVRIVWTDDRHVEADDRIEGDVQKWGGSSVVLQERQQRQIRQLSSFMVVDSASRAAISNVAVNCST
jgi:hypothetical protein